MHRVRRRGWRLAGVFSRCAAVVAGLWLAGGHPASAQPVITGATFSRPVDRYHHDILGDVPEWGALTLRLSNGLSRDVVLPEHQIFEDIAPRLADLDGDGAPEVIAVQSSLSRGARLTVWGGDGRMWAATPYIGRANRWLAPVGAADLDGDGRIEIAYVDRPHLAKVLRVWRYGPGGLDHVADRPFLTNHKIGWGYIVGGIRACPGQAPVMITANGDWSQVMASRLSAGQITSWGEGAYRGPQSLTAALRCAQ